MELVISKHAIARYMQRYHCHNIESAKKHIIAAYKKSKLKRLKGEMEIRKVSDIDMYFICKRMADKVTIITITLGKFAQIKNFATRIDDIDYKAMGNSKMLKKEQK